MLGQEMGAPVAFFLKMRGFGIEMARRCEGIDGGRKR
jgi:hypothetical protein